MALKGNTVPTLLDVAKMKDGAGNISAMAEVLTQTNEILTDMPWKEGNLDTGERTVVRTGLPAVTWRLLNTGVIPSKGTSAQIDEGCGLLETWSEVDAELVKLAGDGSAQFRLNEASAHTEAMNQEFAKTLFYGNATIAPETFTGLANRYSSLSAVNGKNVISAGGVQSDNMSIWLVGWGPNSITGIYPKGTKAGLEHNDLGVQTVTVTTGVGGARMRAFQDQFIWRCGIALKDWRKVVRICNIDVSNLVGKTSAADIEELMIRAYHRVQGIKSVKPVFYMNRTAVEMLDIQRMDNVQGGGGLSYSNISGEPVLSFRGIPIRVVDQLLETEAQVT